MTDAIVMVETDPPVHPGGMLRADFPMPVALTAGLVARAIGISRRRIEGVSAGEIGVGGDTAIRLGRFFGRVSPSWKVAAAAPRIAADRIAPFATAA